MKPGIAADGQARARRSPEYAAAVAVIRAEVEAEFEPLFEQAGLLGRIRLRLRRRRSIERAIAELAPDRAFYL